MAERATDSQGTARGETLRDRTRRAVRSELIDAAVALFTERGYENVTVDEIAQAAGMSRRSFFRYFGSKEAVVLGKFERQGEDFAEVLSARPLDEPPWMALRRMFDPAVAYVSDPELGRRAAEVNRIIHSDESLRAGMVERMQRAESLVVDVLVQREAAHPSGLARSAGDEGQRAGGDEKADERWAPTALVAAAFAALNAASSHSHATGEPLGQALDSAMAAIDRGSSLG